MLSTFPFKRGRGGLMDDGIVAAEPGECMPDLRSIVQSYHPWITKDSEPFI